MFEYNETLEQARQRNITDALMEDIGTGDWTAKLVPSKPVKAQLVVRQAAVLCGVDWFEGTLKKLDPLAKVTWHYMEGDVMKPDTKVCDIEADSRALLSGSADDRQTAVERTGAVHRLVAVLSYLGVKGALSRNI